MLMYYFVWILAPVNVDVRSMGITSRIELTIGHLVRCPSSSNRILDLPQAFSRDGSTAYCIELYWAKRKIGASQGDERSYTTQQGLTLIGKKIKFIMTRANIQYI